MFFYGLRSAAAFGASSLAALALLAGCSPRPATHPLADQATLQAPADWRAEPTTAGLLLLRPALDGAALAGAFVIVARDLPQAGAPPALPAYAAFKEAQAGVGAQSYRATGRRRVELDGVPAERVERAWHTGVEARQGRSWHAVHSGAGWTITASAREADWPRLAPAVERMAGSLRWRTAAP